MSKYQALIEAPSLHDQIINLACKPENMDSEPNHRLSYKVGHRDARHAAAEIAQAQDATIRALLADLERAEKALSKHTKDAEQLAFENWLARVCPSGDVEDVHRQWEASSDFDEINREWADAFDALAQMAGG